MLLATETCRFQSVPITLGPGDPFAAAKDPVPRVFLPKLTRVLCYLGLALPMPGSSTLRDTSQGNPYLLLSISPYCLL